MLFTAKKDGKIIAINETGEFPLMNYDYIEEDTEHQISDYVHCDGQFVLTTSDEAIEQDKERVRQIRNSFLEQTDKYLSVLDFPITDEERKQYKAYRQYLRDYPETECWWKTEPKTFDMFE